jgi:hypothetical protein
MSDEFVSSVKTFVQAEIEAYTNQPKFITWTEDIITGWADDNFNDLVSSALEDTSSFSYKVEQYVDRCVEDAIEDRRYYIEEAIESSVREECRSLADEFVENLGSNMIDSIIANPEFIIRLKNYLLNTKDGNDLICSVISNRLK